MSSKPDGKKGPKKQAPPKQDKNYIFERNRARRAIAHDKRVKAALTKRVKVPRGAARKERRYDMDAWRNNKLKQPTGVVVVNGVVRQ